MNALIVTFDEKNASEITKIRIKVFVEEQGINSEIDFDGLDQIAMHVLVYDQNQAIATGRLLEDGHIGRIAVLKKSRSLGAGSCALQALTDNAQQQGIARVYLGSQTHATGFYEKFGFVICSDVFIEAGIDHVTMEMLLD